MKKILRKITPSPIKKIYHKVRSLPEFWQIYRQPELHRCALLKVKDKKKVVVAFFLMHSSVWKYDGVYKLMASDSRFDPKIIVCPVINNGIENMLYEMEKAYNYFKEKGYAAIRGYDPLTGNFLDVKKEIAPDIIFYTNPHRITSEDFYITQFKEILSCYVPYNFNNSNQFGAQNDQLFHNILWRAFYETDIHMKIASKARNKGRNVVITGYPADDDLVRGSRIENGSWKACSTQKKRIIWAPHHTIDNMENLSYSNFLKYHDFFLSVAQKYHESLQIAFKPHPLLRIKLYGHVDWGQKKTDEYYARWKEMENTQLETDSYIDLFNASDAMILDSGSFTIEYLYCGKPSLFIMFNAEIRDKFNEFGKMALDQHYHAYNQDEIINFIEEVVLEGKDTMKAQRDHFYETYLLPPNGKSASQNIFDHICQEIFA